MVAAAALAITGSFAMSAEANLQGSTFEGNDGNMVVNTTGNHDWANVSPVTGIDTPSGSADNAFGQGTKEDNSNVTVVDGSIPPNKNDLTRFYESDEQLSTVGASGKTGDIMLYLAWERLVNLGNANLDFEINQNATNGFTASTVGPVTLNRTAGDLLVTYDFGGSGTPTLGINTWLTAAAGNTTSQCFASNSLPCWGKHLTLNGATNNCPNETPTPNAVACAEGAVNTASISEPIAGGTLGTGLFGEASIDLTAAGVFQPGVCEALGSMFVKSRSSSSFTAEIKDFIAPQAVSISNCGSITIKKVTQNAPTGDTTSFAYTTSSNLSDFNLVGGGSTTFSKLGAGTYTVTEGAQTAPWNFVSLACDTATGVTITGQKVSINLGNGQDVTCTYTNHYTNSPTIATTLSATTVNIGDSVHDSATLSGASANAGGSVTYHAYAGANTCTGTDLLNDTKTVTNGVVPDSSSITFSTAGYYSFQAVYSGDGNNNGATSVCSTEQLLVKTNPSISTTLSATSVDVGTSVHDSATLSGATNDASGKVTYTVYSDNKCTTGARDAGTVDVTNGLVPDSNALAFNTAGTFYWQAVYTGDGKNNGATSTCTDETLVVNPLQPSVSTAQNLIPNDDMTLSGGFSPTGSITFNLFSPSDTTCSGTPALTQTVPVSGNGKYSTTNTTFKASAEGTWRWMSTYSGDKNNLSATSACGVENFTITNH